MVEVGGHKLQEERHVRSVKLRQERHVYSKRKPNDSVKLRQERHKCEGGKATKFTCRS
jgi:hypothetical protein